MKADGLFCIIFDLWNNKLTRLTVGLAAICINGCFFVKISWFRSYSGGGLFSYFSHTKPFWYNLIAFSHLTLDIYNRQVIFYNFGFLKFQNHLLTLVFFYLGWVIIKSLFVKIVIFSESIVSKSTFRQTSARKVLAPFL